MEAQRNNPIEDFCELFVTPVVFCFMMIVVIVGSFLASVHVFHALDGGIIGWILAILTCIVGNIVQILLLLITMLFSLKIGAKSDSAVFITSSMVVVTTVFGVASFFNKDWSFQFAAASFIAFFIVIAIMHKRLYFYAGYLQRSHTRQKQINVFAKKRKRSYKSFCVATRIKRASSVRRCRDDVCNHVHCEKIRHTLQTYKACREVHNLLLAAQKRDDKLLSAT